MWAAAINQRPAEVVIVFSLSFLLSLFLIWGLWELERADEMGGKGQRGESDTLGRRPLQAVAHTGKRSLIPSVRLVFVVEMQKHNLEVFFFLFFCFKVEKESGFVSPTKPPNCRWAAAVTTALSKRAESSAPLEFAAPSDIITDTSPPLCMDAHAKVLQGFGSMTRCKTASQSSRLRRLKKREPFLTAESCWADVFQVKSNIPSLLRGRI